LGAIDVGTDIKGENWTKIGDAGSVKLAWTE